MKRLKMTSLRQDRSAALLGVILNGGRSSRMGFSKASLELRGGERFLDHAIERFASICPRVVISVGEDSKTSINHKNIISVPDQKQNICLGPMSGILACLQYATTQGFQGCFFTPIDVPNLKAIHLRLIKDRWGDDPSETVCAKNARRKTIEPLISIIPVSMHLSAKESIRKGELSVHRWLRDHNPIGVPIYDDYLKNINSPEDYESLRTIL